VNQARRPPLALIDAATSGGDDRAAYRKIVHDFPKPPDGISQGTIDPLAISIHPAMRDAWQETRTLDEDAPGEDERHCETEDRREAAAYFDHACDAGFGAQGLALPPAPANAHDSTIDGSLCQQAH
jgi:hypothetical protein